MASPAQKRRIGILALIAVIGATAYGDRRPMAAADLAAPISGAIRLGTTIGDLGVGLSAAARNVASFGILYGTVVSRMQPGVRRSILAAVEGVREICTGERRAVPAPVSRCATRKPSRTPQHCTRA